MSYGMKNRSRRKAGAKRFNSDYLNNKTAIRQQKQLGLLRSVFTAASLLFGAFMIYISMHYLPALMQPKQVLKIATGNSAASNTYNFNRKSKMHDIFGPYIKAFQMDRAYLKPGQSISIKYDLPTGAFADLDIVQCRRAWVVEIFDCRVISKFSTRTKNLSGVESFKLKQGGFYHFRQKVSGVPAGEPYRITWERT